MRRYETGYDIRIELEQKLISFDGWVLVGYDHWHKEPLLRRAFLDTPARLSEIDRAYFDRGEVSPFTDSNIRRMMSEIKYISEASKGMSQEDLENIYG